MLNPVGSSGLEQREKANEYRRPVSVRHVFDIEVFLLVPRLPVPVRSQMCPFASELARSLLIR